MFEERSTGPSWHRGANTFLSASREYETRRFPAVRPTASINRRFRSAADWRAAGWLRGEIPSEQAVDASDGKTSRRSQKSGQGDGASTAPRAEWDPGRISGSSGTF